MAKCDSIASGTVVTENITVGSSSYNHESSCESGSLTTGEYKSCTLYSSSRSFEDRVEDTMETDLYFAVST